MSFDHYDKLPQHQDTTSCFPKRLPSNRLGRETSSLNAFRLQQGKVHHFSMEQVKTKEFSFVLVTESSDRRVLLGQKHRGFGQGLYNVFAGKVEASETPLDCACRELQEESGISASPSHLHSIGTVRYTFADQPAFEMVAHVFHLDIQCLFTNPTDVVQNDTATPKSATTTAPVLHIHPDTIRGCEEITPQWFPDWFRDLPLDNMFADDSLWLPPYLLGLCRGERLSIDGWFHFRAGGQEINSILCFYLDIQDTTQIFPATAPTSTPSSTLSISANPPPQPTKRYSLEQRLFYALRSKKIQNPSVKEFDEGWAFSKALQRLFGNNYPFDVVIDVAGGHGALAGFLLVLTSATRAVVIDPACVGKGNVERAWRDDFWPQKTLTYRYQDLRTALPDELERTLRTVPRERVLVVACHACQHLSDEILQIVCCEFRGVHAAVMPCCQRDPSPGSSWKANTKRFGVPIDKMMDLLLAGKAMSWQNGHTQSEDDNQYVYDVRMKLIDPKITPQNRIIFCKAIPKEEFAAYRDKSSNIDAAHQRLAATYNKAHQNGANSSEQHGTRTIVNGNNGGNSEQQFKNLSSKKNFAVSASSKPWVARNYHFGALCALFGFGSGFWLAWNLGRPRRS